MESEIANPREDASAVYLYCLTSRIASCAAKGKGLDERFPAFPCLFGDVVAVISMVPVEEFCGDVAEARLSDLKWVGPRACRHEEVVERVMASAPVLPARFGTIFSSEEALGRLVSRQSERIRGFLDDMESREEWAVRGFLDRTAAEAQLLARETREACQPSSAGVRYLMERRARSGAGRRIGIEAGKATRDAEREMRRWALDLRPKKIQRREISGRREEMVFNWAVLLEREAAEMCAAAVRQLNAKCFETGLCLEMVGPWPPYSFCPSLADAEGDAAAGGAAEGDERPGD